MEQFTSFKLPAALRSVMKPLTVLPRLAHDTNHHSIRSLHAADTPHPLVTG